MIKGKDKTFHERYLLKQIKKRDRNGKRGDLVENFYLIFEKKKGAFILFYFILFFYQICEVFTLFLNK